MLTAYDANIASLLVEAEIDYILVGDSLGMVVFGFPNTRRVTMDDICRHTEAVRNGAPNSQIISDMPINSYNNPNQAIKNARLLLDAGADFIKLEGSLQIVKYLINNKIKVFGHLGLLPQTAQSFSKVGKNNTEAEEIFNQAIEMDDFPVTGLVLECISDFLAKKITENIKCPTFGIGSGPHCRGEVRVINDILGMYKNSPPFIKPKINLNKIILKSILEFKEDFS